MHRAPTLRKNQSMKKYPIGIQSFEKIRSGNFYYVDKTEFVYNLIK